jgi:hypothetical protein
MTLTKCSRAAIIATLNAIALKSVWMALPVDDLCGCQIVFVHKKAAALFGEVSTASLFARNGEASELAVGIYRIACDHGMAAATPTMTACPIMVETADREYFTH